MKLTKDPDIAGLQRRLQDGTYSVPAEKVAEAMMGWLMRFELSIQVPSLEGTPPGIES